MFAKLFRLVNIPTSSQVDGGAPIGEYDVTNKTVQFRQRIPVETTAVARTITAADSGKFIIVTAAVTITLPACTPALKGVWVDIMVGADVDVLVAATAGELVSKNDLASNSVTWNTASEKIGSGARFICSGSKWYIQHHTEELATTTAAT